MCLCGWTQIKGCFPELWRAEEPAGPRAYYTGLQKCGLRWVCPVCTRKASEEAREQLNAALAAAREGEITPAGWVNLVPCMVTLTARHDEHMALADFRGRLARANTALKTTRGWKAMNGPGGSLLGIATAEEATYGRAGWHPHLHVLMVVRAEDEPEALAKLEWLREAWLHQLVRVGLDGASAAARKHAIDIQGAAEAGSYIAKWGAAEELALSSSKTGRRKGKTPWQLLRDARTAPTISARKEAAALWWEFVQVMKGAHQVRFSPALKAFTEAWKARQQPAEPAAAVEEWCVLPLTSNEWTDRGRWRRVRMVEAAEAVPASEAKQAAILALMDRETDRTLTEDVAVIEEEDEPPPDPPPGGPCAGRSAPASSHSQQAYATAARTSSRGGDRSKKGGGPHSAPGGPRDTGGTPCTYDRILRDFWDFGRAPARSITG